MLDGMRISRVWFAMVVTLGLWPGVTVRAQFIRRDAPGAVEFGPVAQGNEPHGLVPRAVGAVAGQTHPTSQTGAPWTRRPELEGAVGTPTRVTAPPVTAVPDASAGSTAFVSTMGGPLQRDAVAMLGRGAIVIGLPHPEVGSDGNLMVQPNVRVMGQEAPQAAGHPSTATRARSTSARVMTVSHGGTANVPPRANQAAPVPQSGQAQYPWAENAAADEVIPHQEMPRLPQIDPQRMKYGLQPVQTGFTAWLQGPQEAAPPPELLPGPGMEGGAILKGDVAAPMFGELVEEHAGACCPHCGTKDGWKLFGNPCHCGKMGPLFPGCPKLRDAGIGRERVGNAIFEISTTQPMKNFQIRMDSYYNQIGRSTSGQRSAAEVRRCRKRQSTIRNCDSRWRSAGRSSRRRRNSRFGRSTRRSTTTRRASAT